jgi:predicted SnoaL-like aldol condensation-catalyzing enzyme
MQSPSLRNVVGLIAVLTIGAAQAQIIPKQTPARHAYSPYEQRVLNTVKQFHQNFNAHAFAKNGDLVANDLIVDSNGAEVHGREAFVARIARFAEPFPDVQIDDLDTVVDGDVATVRFVLTGTQKGDLPTSQGVIKATNKSIHVDGVEVFYFNKDAKLQKLVTIECLDQLMAQLKQ